MNSNNKSSGKPIELTEGLWLNKRQLSIAIAVIIAMAFFTFMVGYFWGHKKAIEQLSYRLDQDSLADQVYSSMCGLYDNKDDTENEEAESQEEPQEETSAVQAPAVAQPVVVDTPKPSKIPGYFAQLAGFGTQMAAQKLADRLNGKGISVRVTTRESTSSQGKKIKWYQVVTHPALSKKELEDTIEKIKKIEKLKGIRIVSDR